MDQDGIKFILEKENFSLGLRLGLQMQRESRYTWSQEQNFSFREHNLREYWMILNKECKSYSYERIRGLLLSSISSTNDHFGRNGASIPGKPHRSLRSSCSIHGNGKSKPGMFERKWKKQWKYENHTWKTTRSLCLNGNTKRGNSGSSFSQCVNGNTAI